MCQNYQVVSKTILLFPFQMKHSMLIKQQMYGKKILTKSLLLELNLIMMLKQQPKTMHQVCCSNWIETA